jgi:hypothetical protein
LIATHGCIAAAALRTVLRINDGKYQLPPKQRINIDSDEWPLAGRPTPESRLIRDYKSTSTVTAFYLDLSQFAAVVISFYPITSESDESHLFRANRYALLWLIDHPWHFFSILLLGLLFCVNLGFHFRHRDEQNHSQIESARDGLNVLLSLLLGFMLPMAHPHYDQRKELIVDEANAISTVHLRAEMLPEPFRGKILGELREYLNSRTDFGKETDESTLRASLARSKQLLNEMQQQAIALVEQGSNSVTPIFVQALNQLSDLTEKRLAAEENRIPTAIWLMVVLIAVLAGLITGYSIRHRRLVEMMVLPLTVAIVMALVAELDSPRSGVIQVSQQSMERLQLEFDSAAPRTK